MTSPLAFMESGGLNRRLLKPVLIAMFLAMLSALKLMADSEARLEPPPTQADDSPNPSLAYIQRSMKSMQEGSAPVRILFYGQSITQGKWIDIVVDGLNNRFPSANIEVEKRAIGGFSAPLLRGTAHTDLYPYYPDLLIFHVYGDLDCYEEIIARTRATTTAEIVMTTDHVANPPPRMPKRGEMEDERAKRLASIAQKYKCTLIDIRGKWKAHLQESRKPASAFLRDNVHFNDEGHNLYARFVLEDLRRIPQLGDNEEFAAMIREVGVDSPEVEKLPDGGLRLPFDGNRIVAVASSQGGRAKVSVDGKAPSQWPGTWVNTRTSFPPSGTRHPRPVLTRVAFEQLPVEEDWVLTILSGSKPDGSEVRFSVRGSVTGEDGEGISTQPFRSDSGRAAIQPEAWTLQRQLRFSRMELPQKPFEVTWRTTPMVPDVYTSGKEGEMRNLLVGLENGAHVLTLEPVEPGEPLGVSSFLIYRPDPAIRIPQPVSPESEDDQD